MPDQPIDHHIWFRVSSENGRIILDFNGHGGPGQYSLRIQQHPPSEPSSSRGQPTHEIHNATGRAHELQRTDSPPNRSSEHNSTSDNRSEHQLLKPIKLEQEDERPTTPQPQDDDTAQALPNLSSYPNCLTVGPTPQQPLRHPGTPHNPLHFTVEPATGNGDSTTVVSTASSPSATSASDTENLHCTEHLPSTADKQPKPESANKNLLLLAQQADPPTEESQSDKTRRKRRRTDFSQFFRRRLPLRATRLAASLRKKQRVDC